MPGRVKGPENSRSTFWTSKPGSRRDPEAGALVAWASRASTQLQANQVVVRHRRRSSMRGSSRRQEFASIGKMFR
eukprot:6204013-Pleurochrysis_carterae.AAC.2